MATLPVVNIADNRKGIATSLIVMLAVLLYLWFTTFEMADPPPQVHEVVAETEFPKELLFKDLKVEGGAMSGDPSDDPIDRPREQTEKLLTKKENPDSKVTTGQSTHTNATNNTNTASTVTQSNDPFATGGNNGGPGPGSTFGQSTGSVNGPGPGSGIERVRLNDPSFDKNISNEYATIKLVLTIDSQGNVISGQCIKGSTTTTNQNLINKVINEVIRQVKYNKDPGASLAKVSMSVLITPQ